jgi:hypothetical protein
MEGEGRAASCPTRERTSRVARALFIDEGNLPKVEVRLVTDMDGLEVDD